MHAAGKAFVNEVLLDKHMCRVSAQSNSSQPIKCPVEGCENYLRTYTMLCNHVTVYSHLPVF